MSNKICGPDIVKFFSVESAGNATGSTGDFNVCEGITFIKTLSGCTDNININGNTFYNNGGVLYNHPITACTGIYTSNLYGCSPITIHDNLQSVGSNAGGFLSLAFGNNTLTTASYSHAEGRSTNARAIGSHAEGFGTTTLGNYSHAEGFGTTALGNYSHAEGYQTLTSGFTSNTQGRGTIAYGDYSYAGGFLSKARGNTSFIHSTNSIVLGSRSVVLGGENLTGFTDDTVYVPYLNINNILNNQAVNNLGIDSDGNVVVGFSDGIYVTGGTYTPSGNTVTLTRNDGVEVNITGVTGTYVTGGTATSNNTLVLNYNNGLGSTSPIELPTRQFTGNTSGQCIGDIFVSNIHSCSPLNINPNDEGNVYFGSTSGVTIDILSGRIVANTLKSDGSEIYNIPLSGVTNLQTELDGKINSVNSVGESNELFKDKSGTTLNFRTLSGGSNTTISTVGDVVKVDVTVPIDTNNYVTGFTYNDANTFTISRNGGLSDLTSTINTVTGLTVNGTLSTDSITSPSIQITGGVGQEGTFSWNSEDNTVDLQLNNVTLQLGQELHYHVINQTGEQINNGEVVYVVGVSSDKLSVAPYSISMGVDADLVLGVATEDIPDTEFGFVTRCGTIRDVNTSGFTVGTVLYALTGSTYTDVTPTPPNHTILLGFVTKEDATEGSISLKVNHERDADEIKVNLSGSSLTSTNVQEALLELNSKKVNVGALSSNIILYPTTGTSVVGGGYLRMVTDTDDPDYNTTPVDVGTGAISSLSGQLIASLASDEGLFVGNPGVINITTLGNIRKVSGNRNAYFYYELYQRDSGGTETLISTSDNTPIITNTNYEEFFASSLLNNGIWGPTDRVVIKYYGVKASGGGNNPVYEFQFGGDSPVRTLLPVPVSVVPSEDADSIQTDTSSFNNILSGSDTDVQKALDTLDDHSHTLQQITSEGNITTDRIIIGDLTVDTDTIYTDGSGNVGIGTTTPTEALDVNGNTKISGLLNIGALGTGTSVNNLGVDSSGNIVTGTTSSGGGIFGISDSNGEYTYYDTLQDAIDAASAGETVEMFADVLETSAVTITLKNGVNINGNGHTYELNTADATPAIITPNSISNFRASIQNMIITRSNSTSDGYCIGIGVNTTGYLDLTGTIINNTGAGRGITAVSAAGNIQISNATVYTDSGHGIFIAANSLLGGAINCIVYSNSGIGIRNTGGKIVNCYSESTSNYGIHNLTEAHNCTAKSGGTDGFLNANRAFHCIGISTGGSGYYSQNSTKNYNCTGYSTASYGFRTLGTGNHIISNCSGYSTAAAGMLLSGALRANNCFAYSTVSFAYQGSRTVDLYNCTGESLGAATVYYVNNIYNCTLKCAWDDTSGHVIDATNSSLREYFNNTLITTNASANAIYSVNAQSLYIGSNVYKGMTTPLGANITQAQVNTPDAFGNILIG